MSNIDKLSVHPWALSLVLFLLIWLTACAPSSPTSITETPLAKAPAQTSAIVPTDTPVKTETERSTPIATPLPAARQPATATPSPSSTSAPTAIAKPDLSCPPWTWTASDHIHPDWPAFTFKVVGMDCGDFAEGHRIEIYQADTASPIQIIEGRFGARGLRDSGQGFDIVDMNFDGYQDIRLLDEMMAGSNEVLYQHWLFYPQTETFVANEAMNQRIGRAEFDAEQQQIRAFWRAGSAGQTTDYYHWVDGELTFIRQVEEQSVAEGVNLVIVREEVDGKLIVRDRKIVREQGLDATWLVLSELGDNFLRLATSPMGSVWAVSRDSLLQFDGQVWHIFDLPADLRQKISAETSSLAQTVTDLAVTADDIVWIGTREDGLYRFAKGIWHHDTPVEDLPHQGVLHLAVDTMQDREWAIFGDNTRHAVAYFDGQHWQPFPLDNVGGGPDNIAVSATGDVWLAVSGRRPGPYLFDGSRWVWAINGWNAGSRDMFIASSLTGDVWFGSDYGWVRWTGLGWQGLNVRIPAPFSFPVAVDAEGGAWGIVTQFCYWCKIPNYNENGAVYVTPNRSCRFTAADGLGDPPLDPPPDPFTGDPPRPDVVRDITVTADGRVWFITQGKITVFSPQSPICDYAAPENVRIPEEPDPSTCPTQPERFIELWQARLENLGCPVTGTGQPVPIAEQTFEGGWMLWRGDTATILVFPVGRHFLQFEDTWGPTQPVYTCPDLAPAQTPPTPQRGFGKVWCLEEGIRDMLGQSISEEHLFEADIQAFENGTIFATDEGVTYILRSIRLDWERLE
jgi:hypothetical protein